MSKSKVPAATSASLIEMGRRKKVVGEPRRPLAQIAPEGWAGVRFPDLEGARASSLREAFPRVRRGGLWQISSCWGTIYGDTLQKYEKAPSQCHSLSAFRYLCRHSYFISSRIILYPLPHTV